MNRQLHKISLAAALSFFAFAPLALALDLSSIPIPDQVPDLEEQIQSTVSPEYPHPNDQVTITLQAYGTNLDNAAITWAVDGKISSQGQGKKVFSIQAGDVGQTTTVTATIVPLYGMPITKAFYIDPQTVDIIWEAHTYTPPFYKGKAMFTPQEKVVFVAMPVLADQSGSIVRPGAISYKWRQDNVVLGSQSGYGVQTLSYTGDILLHPVDIDVEASIENGNTAKNNITLGPTSPIVGVYEDSPLYGILFNHELSGGFDFGAAAERTVAAMPYYFGTQGRTDADLSYAWSINGSAINVPQSQNEMTFRNTQNAEGKSVIGVDVKNSANFLESASGGTVINFKKPARTFSF